MAVRKGRAREASRPNPPKESSGDYGENAQCIMHNAQGGVDGNECSLSAKSNAEAKEKHAKGHEGVVARQGKTVEKPRTRAFCFPPPAEAPDQGGVEQRSAKHEDSDSRFRASLDTKRE